MTVTHAPPDYECPFCRLAAGGGDALSGPDDIVRRTSGALALISPRMWPNNRGHVLVVPTEHHENLYDQPPAAGHAVQDLVREMAVAIRHCYGSPGVSTRQHNEPAGDQDVWHYHVHVFPRYPDDGLYRLSPLPGYQSAERRRPYADRLRAHFADA
ncbi:HIT domain-containing protein [Longispora sp. NPDC051575]|uniref:HIT family protein n=1 Tax=Longispora sp. NPDC051575 TaxID=3154943 RepID=UPI0034445A10